MELALAAFLTWQFAVACVAVQAIMQTLAKVTKAVAPKAFSSKWFRGFVALQNLVWGAAMAIPHGFLMGETYGHRVFVGLGAGFLSHSVYEIFLKRLKPAKEKES